MKVPKGPISTSLIRSGGMLRHTVDRPRSRADETVQVRVRKNCVVGGYSGGTVFWTTPAKAQLYVGQRAVEIVGQQTPPVVAPVALVEQDPTYPKSYDAPSIGPSTDSASSTPPGQEVPLFALAADQVSPDSKSNTSDAPAPVANAESSSSTTPTSSPPGQTLPTSPTPDGGSGTTRSRSGRRSRE